MDKSGSVLAERVRAIHERSQAAYGAPRIHAALVHEGAAVGRKRVARLMREVRLEGREPAQEARNDAARPEPLVRRSVSSVGSPWPFVSSKDWYVRISTTTAERLEQHRPPPHHLATRRLPAGALRHNPRTRNRRSANT